MLTQSKDEFTAPVAREATPANLKFGKGNEFYHELRRRVDQHFTSTGTRPNDNPRMYVKTAFIFAWLAAAYVGLVFFAETWWVALALAALVGLAIAAVGFNVQHDGSHNAYSKRGWVNKLMALTLDAMGGSSYVWAKRHNTAHHSYTNITGHDEDINLGVLGRLSPHQPVMKFHRFQHLYLWVLYGLFPIKWQLFDDVQDLLTARHGNQVFAKPKWSDWVVFLTGKVLFLTLAFGIPLLLHPWWTVALFYIAATFVLGLTLSTVFQLAHAVQEAAFPLPDDDSGRMETPWAIHQVETTVNFGRNNRLLTWYVGGLNFQIEHHLFPHICHVHYPALAPLVEATCQEFGVKYVAHETMRAAVASHFAWLRRMGQPDAVPQPAPAPVALADFPGAPRAAAQLLRPAQQEVPSWEGVPMSTATLPAPATAAPATTPVPFALRMANLIVILLPFIGLVAAFTTLWGWGFSWVDLGLLTGMYILTALGITVGYHRLFTHRAFETHGFVQVILGVLGSMAAEGPLLSWVATHRYHHRFSDQKSDRHSPYRFGQGFWGMIHGLWNAHIGWLFTPEPKDLARYAGDLNRSTTKRVVSSLFLVWVALGLLLPAVLGGILTQTWTGAILGFLWGGLVRMFLVHHVTWSINSVCHLWGGQPYKTTDHSKNNAVFGILAMGEGWHNNHHAFPTSARHGLSWWQIDMSYWVIRALALFGLAWKVRVPTKQEMSANRA